MELKALCMKCRDENKKPTMQTMTNPVVSKNDKGRYSAKGTCNKCGGNMFKFISEIDVEKIVKNVYKEL